MARQTDRKSGLREKISIISRLRAFPKYMLDNRVPLLKKVGVTALIAYILSPVDAIPELILPFVGWIDDLGLLAILLKWMHGELGRYQAGGYHLDSDSRDPDHLDSTMEIPVGRRNRQIDRTD